MSSRARARGHRSQPEITCAQALVAFVRGYHRLVHQTQATQCASAPRPPRAGEPLRARARTLVNQPHIPVILVEFWVGCRGPCKPELNCLVLFAGNMPSRLNWIEAYPILMTTSKLKQGKLRAFWSAAVHHLGAECSCVQNPSNCELKELANALRFCPNVPKLLRNARARNRLEQACILARASILV